METVEEKVGEKLGNYQLVREAGRGAMSIVYEAVDTRVERKVALKVGLSLSHPSPEARERLIARLKREARAVARLSHPNIVTIHDVGEQDGHHFLVMEYLEGVTLRERMDEGPLSLAEASRILDQVAAALDAAHARGVVHRDIKPSNVMLLPGGHVKVMDFGLARQADESIMTQDGAMVGSPSYMAPEQVRGEVSASSDVWAVGVLLYEMLAGRAPFAGDSVVSVLYQTVHEAPRPLPEMPVEVQRVLRRALEKDPAKRYSSAGELAEAFRAAAPAPAEAPRRRQRKRAAAGAGARAAVPAWAARPVVWVVALLLVAAGVVVPFVLQNKHRAPMEAIRQRINHRAAAARKARPETAAKPPPRSEAARQKELRLKRQLKAWDEQVRALQKGR